MKKNEYQCTIKEIFEYNLIIFKNILQYLENYNLMPIDN